MPVDGIEAIERDEALQTRIKTLLKFKGSHHEVRLKFLSIINKDDFTDFIEGFQTKEMKINKIPKSINIDDYFNYI
jgi:hypothetical protein